MGAALGGLAALALAALLLPLRDELANTSIALILVLPVLLGAVIGGAAGGAVSSLSATASFDFFFTRPYNSLTISRAQDLETALLLLVVGLLVGTVAAHGRRASVAAERAGLDVRRIHRVAELVADGSSAEAVIDEATVQLTAMLNLAACPYEPQPVGLPLPRLDRTGVVVGAPHRFAGQGFALPAGGTELPVLGQGRQWGRFVLQPGEDRNGVPLEERILAVAIADQVGAAIAAENNREGRLP